MGCSHSRFFLFLLILILFVCLYIYVEVRSFAFECESYLLFESMLTTRQAHPAAASSPREMRVVLWSTPSPAGIPQLRQHQHEIDVVGSPSLHVPFVSRLPRRRAARCWILAPRHRCCAALSTSTRTHDPAGGYDTDLVHGGTFAANTAHARLQHRLYSSTWCWAAHNWFTFRTKSRTSSAVLTHDAGTKFCFPSWPIRFCPRGYRSDGLPTALSWIAPDCGGSEFDCLLMQISRTQTP